MLRSRIFWHLYLPYTALVVITTIAIGLFVQHEMSRTIERDLEQRLIVQASALVPLATGALAGGQLQPVQQTIAEIAASAGIRITVLGPDGVVLVDSDRDPIEMDAPIARPEVARAMENGSATSRRYSDTVRGDVLYFAHRIDRDSSALGVVRVAMPLSRLGKQLAAMRMQIVRGASVGIVLALGLGVFMARRFAAPIADMTRVSAALREGDYEARVRTVGFDEIGTLGTNVNRLADELQERIARLSHQGAELNAILRGMEEGVVALGPEGTIAFTNRSARTLLGLSPEAEAREVLQALGRIDGFDELLAGVRSSGTPLQREVIAGDRGEELVLDARATPLETGQERGVLVVLYNLTHLRRLERIRTDFVANVSHELKTPLTSIQGYVETLLDGAVHDADHNLRFLHKIQQHVRRLSALVSDLLSLARIETPATNLELQPVDWHELVRESAARRQDPIASKGLRLELDLGDTAVQVLGEREGLRQIVDNLLDNAINYTPEGGSVHVRVRSDEDAAVLSITDTGIGIPAEALDRIFERFYRVDRGRSRALGGTGLGLSIVRNLVQRMNGTVSVQSTVGEGSTFTVSIPRAPA